MKVSTVLALAAGATAQNMSLCDKYTTALLKDNTAANQQTLLTLVVNTAVIGNYTKPNVGIAVPGILAPGTGKYAGVNLLPYFNGMLASTAPRDGSNMGVSVNFLSDGGATPLMMNKPANGTSSAQYTLLTHLYEYFGYLLGCSAPGFPAYAGSTSMYKVHQYMALDAAEVGWFINNVGLSAASFGVSNDDVMAVGKALTDSFDYRCAPPASIPKTAAPALQAICIADDCPVSPNATCSSYAAVVQPKKVNGTMGSASSTGSGMGSGAKATSSGSGMPASYTGGANSYTPVGVTFAGAAMGLAAYLL